MKSSALVFLSIAALVTGQAQAYSGMQKQGDEQIQSSVEQISVLPKPFPIEAVPFTNSQGNGVDFSHYKGKVIMVNIWATWCPPCVRELPAISRLVDKVGSEEFEVLPISIDRDGNKQVEPFLTSLGMEDFTTYYNKERSYK